MRLRRRRAVVLMAGALIGLAACGSGGSSGGPTTNPTVARTPTATSPASAPGTSSSPAPRRRPGHVVVVVMENHSYSDIIGKARAPYLNALARRGMSLSQMHAVTHPSQPNYIALFSGSTHGVTDDACPQRLTAASLGDQLRQAHLSFAGYSQGLPRAGSSECTVGRYARKHVPWADFPSLPASTNLPFSAFPSDYTRLPTVSFVIPNLVNDMHDGTVARGDAWLAKHLNRYARWAAAHRSLLVVTWDEDDRSEDNRIPTIVVGAGIRRGNVADPVTLYSVLRLIEDRYDLPRLGAAATAPPIPLHRR